MEPPKQSVIVIILAVLLINVIYGSTFLLRKSNLDVSNRPPLPESANILSAVISSPETLRNSQDVGLIKTSSPSVLPGIKIVKYEVQLHDNPSTIAARFGITVETILAANNLKYGQSIYPGDEIAILPVSGIKHIVKQNDTIASIAHKYNVSSATIIKFNKLHNNTLLPGKTLIIPGVKVKISAVPLIVRKKKIDKYFINPASGVITQYLHDHNAIDVGNKCGTSIYAAASGKIVREKWGVRAGRYIIIEHANKTKTLYAHLSKFLIHLGAYVKQGQRIGLMGTSGRSTGCHLHFDVYGARNPLARYRVGDRVK